MHVTHGLRPDAPTPEELVGEQLRQLRKARGWSQEDVARKMSALGFGMHQSTVGRLESAQLPLRLNEAIALASLYGTSLDALLGGTTGMDAETLDEEIRKTEEQLRQAADEHQEIWRRLGDIEAEEAGLQANRDAMSARVAFLQATLQSLQRARQQQEAAK
jgi:transcriptional regulator with XRE-family HTH domain